MTSVEQFVRQGLAAVANVDYEAMYVQQILSADTNIFESARTVRGRDTITNWHSTPITGSNPQWATTTLIAGAPIPFRDAFIEMRFKVDNGDADEVAGVNYQNDLSAFSWDDSAIAVAGRPRRHLSDYQIWRRPNKLVAVNPRDIFTNIEIRINDTPVLHWGSRELMQLSQVILLESLFNPDLDPKYADIPKPLLERVHTNPFATDYNRALCLAYPMDEADATNTIYTCFINLRHLPVSRMVIPQETTFQIILKTLHASEHNNACFIQNARSTPAAAGNPAPPAQTTLTTNANVAIQSMQLHFRKWQQNTPLTSSLRHLQGSVLLPKVFNDLDLLFNRSRSAVVAIQEQLTNLTSSPYLAFILVVVGDPKSRTTPAGDNFNPLDLGAGGQFFTPNGSYITVQGDLKVKNQISPISVTAGSNAESYENYTDWMDVRMRQWPQRDRLLTYERFKSEFPCIFLSVYKFDGPSPNVRVFSDAANIEISDLTLYVPAPGEASPWQQVMLFGLSQQQYTIGANYFQIQKTTRISTQPLRPGQSVGVGAVNQILSNDTDIPQDIQPAVAQVIREMSDPVASQTTVGNGGTQPPGAPQ